MGSSGTSDPQSQKGEDNREKPHTHVHIHTHTHTHTQSWFWTDGLIGLENTTAHLSSATEVSQ